MLLKNIAIKTAVRTYLSPCAFVIQRAKGNSRQQNGNVEENGGGGVLQETTILTRYTLMEH